MRDQNRVLQTVLDANPVIPVVTIEDPGLAVELARALLAGGISAIEVTLRTAVAIEAIKTIAKTVPEIAVGAGTVLTPAQYALASTSGARFCVAPGASPALLDAAEASAVPLLPGAMTPTEVLSLLERGYRLQKFFPAEAAGGIAMVKAMASPIPAVRFCPTGGVTAQSAFRYLSLPNVICVGGSWVAPETMLQSRDFSGIARLASAAAGLRVRERKP